MQPMNSADEKRATEEKRLSFFPSQGLTGVTFLGKEFQADQVQLKPGRKTLGWSPRFKLTEDQIAALHPELKWIVSFPLTIMDKDVRRALGVLNIDGLIPDIDELGLRALEPILNGLSYRMIPLVASFADKLSSGLEKARLSVYLEDCDV